MSDKDVCKTAPATQGLFKTLMSLLSPLLFFFFVYVTFFFQL